LGILFIKFVHIRYAYILLCANDWVVFITHHSISNNNRYWNICSTHIFNLKKKYNSSHRVTVTVRLSSRRHVDTNNTFIIVIVTVNNGFWSVLETFWSLRDNLFFFGKFWNFFKVNQLVSSSGGSNFFPRHFEWNAKVLYERFILKVNK